MRNVDGSNSSSIHLTTIRHRHIGWKLSFLELINKYFGFILEKTSSVAAPNFQVAQFFSTSVHFEMVLQIFSFL